MEIVKIVDIVDDPNHPLMTEVANSLLGEEGDEIICRNCEQKYIRGAWNFYNLCNTCFAEFDKKKTEERLKFLNNQL